MDGDRSFGARATRALTRVVVTLVVLALAAAVVFLLSERNARAFFTEVKDGALVIEKGKMMPVGAEPFHPSDAAIADAYAPIPLDGASPGDLPERRFSERDELDRALFELLERLARARVDSDEPAVLDRGLYYIRRGEKLSGLSPEQRNTLKELQADVAFYIARTKLDDARRQIAEALAELKIAADGQNRHARTANQMLLEVDPSARSLEESLRKAVHTLSGPASESSDATPRTEPAAPPTTAATPTSAPRVRPPEAKPPAQK